MKAHSDPNYKNGGAITDIIKSLSHLFLFKKVTFPLHFIWVTEKFDVVQRLQYKGWPLRPDSE